MPSFCSGLSINLLFWGVSPQTPRARFTRDFVWAVVAGEPPSLLGLASLGHLYAFPDFTDKKHIYRASVLTQTVIYSCSQSQFSRYCSYRDHLFCDRVGLVFPRRKGTPSMYEAASGRLRVFPRKEDTNKGISPLLKHKLPDFVHSWPVAFVRAFSSGTRTPLSPNVLWARAPRVDFFFRNNRELRVSELVMENPYEQVQNALLARIINNVVSWQCWVSGTKSNFRKSWTMALPLLTRRWRRWIEKI